MDTTIYYYTGTGNSLWVARTLARELGGADVVSIAESGERVVVTPFRTVGIVFPVHMWGLPSAVIRFADRLKTLSPEYVFAVAVNAGQVSNTLVQTKRLLARKGLVLSLGFEVKTPSNYIPWGGPGPIKEQKRLFESARAKISGMAAQIQRREQGLVEKGPFWQRLLFTLLYKVTFPMVSKMDKKFWVDEKCNQCGICMKVCPTGNIAIQDGKPVWHHQCEQCFACLQWCPREAIQYGKKTPLYERYHHPEIHVKDMLETHHGETA
jgi:ferredoxin